MFLFTKYFKLQQADSLRDSDREQQDLRIQLTAAQQQHSLLAQQYAKDKATFDLTIDRLGTIHEGIKAKLQEDASYIESLEAQNSDLQARSAALEEQAASQANDRAAAEDHRQILEQQLQAQREQEEQQRLQDQQLQERLQELGQREQAQQRRRWRRIRLLWRVPTISPSFRWVSLGFLEEEIYVLIMIPLILLQPDDHEYGEVDTRFTGSSNDLSLLQVSKSGYNPAWPEEIDK